MRFRANSQTPFGWCRHLGRLRERPESTQTQSSSLKRLEMQHAVVQWHWFEINIPAITVGCVSHLRIWMNKKQNKTEKKTTPVEFSKKENHFLICPAAFLRFCTFKPWCCCWQACLLGFNVHYRHTSGPRLLVKSCFFFLKSAFKAGSAQGFHYFWPTARVLMCFPLRKFGKVFRNGI